MNDKLKQALDEAAEEYIHNNGLQSTICYASDIDLAFKACATWLLEYLGKDEHTLKYNEEIYANRIKDLEARLAASEAVVALLEEKYIDTSYDDLQDKVLKLRETLELFMDSTDPRIIMLARKALEQTV